MADAMEWGVQQRRVSRFLDSLARLLHRKIGGQVASWNASQLYQAFTNSVRSLPEGDIKLRLLLSKNAELYASELRTRLEDFIRSDSVSVSRLVSHEEEETPELRFIRASGDELVGDASYTSAVLSTVKALQCGDFNAENAEGWRIVIERLIHARWPSPPQLWDAFTSVLSVLGVQSTELNGSKPQSHYFNEEAFPLERNASEKYFQSILLHATIISKTFQALKILPSHFISNRDVSIALSPIVSQSLTLLKHLWTAFFGECKRFGIDADESLPLKKTVFKNKSFKQALVLFRKVSIDFFRSISMKSQFISVGDANPFISPPKPPSSLVQYLDENFSYTPSWETNHEEIRSEEYPVDESKYSFVEFNSSSLPDHTVAGIVIMRILSEFLHSKYIEKRKNFEKKGNSEITFSRDFRLLVVYSFIPLQSDFRGSVAYLLDDSFWDNFSFMENEHVFMMRNLIYESLLFEPSANFSHPKSDFTFFISRMFCSRRLYNLHNSSGRVSESLKILNTVQRICCSPDFLTFLERTFKSRTIKLPKFPPASVFSGPRNAIEWIVAKADDDTFFFIYQECFNAVEITFKNKINFKYEERKTINQPTYGTQQIETDSETERSNDTVKEIGDEAGNESNISSAPLFFIDRERTELNDEDMERELKDNHENFINAAKSMRGDREERRKKSIKKNKRLQLQMKMNEKESNKNLVQNIHSTVEDKNEYEITIRNGIGVEEKMRANAVNGVKNTEIGERINKEKAAVGEEEVEFKMSNLVKVNEKSEGVDGENEEEEEVREEVEEVLVKENTKMAELVKVEKMSEEDETNGVSAQLVNSEEEEDDDDESGEGEEEKEKEVEKVREEIVEAEELEEKVKVGETSKLEGVAPRVVDPNGGKEEEEEEEDNGDEEDESNEEEEEELVREEVEAVIEKENIKIAELVKIEEKSAEDETKDVSAQLVNADEGTDEEEEEEEEGEEEDDDEGEDDESVEEDEVKAEETREDAKIVESVKDVKMVEKKSQKDETKGVSAQFVNADEGTVEEEEEEREEDDDDESEEEEEEEEEEVKKEEKVEVKAEAVMVSELVRVEEKSEVEGVALGVVDANEGTIEDDDDDDDDDDGEEGEEDKEDEKNVEAEKGKENAKIVQSVKVEEKSEVEVEADADEEEEEEDLDEEDSEGEEDEVEVEKEDKIKAEDGKEKVKVDEKSEMEDPKGVAAQAMDVDEEEEEEDQVQEVGEGVEGDEFKKAGLETGNKTQKGVETEVLDVEDDEDEEELDEEGEEEEEEEVEEKVEVKEEKGRIANLVKGEKVIEEIVESKARELKGMEEEKSPQVVKPLEKVEEGEEEKNMRMRVEIWKATEVHQADQVLKHNESHANFKLRDSTETKSKEKEIHVDNELEKYDEKHIGDKNVEKISKSEDVISIDDDSDDEQNVVGEEEMKDESEIRVLLAGSERKSENTEVNEDNEVKKNELGSPLNIEASLLSKRKLINEDDTKNEKKFKDFSENLWSTNQKMEKNTVETEKSFKVINTFNVDENEDEDEIIEFLQNPGDLKENAERLENETGNVEQNDLIETNERVDVNQNDQNLLKSCKRIKGMKEEKEGKLIISDDNINDEKKDEINVGENEFFTPESRLSRLRFISSEKQPKKKTPSEKELNGKKFSDRKSNLKQSVSPEKVKSEGKVISNAKSRDKRMSTSDSKSSVKQPENFSNKKITDGSTQDDENIGIIDKDAQGDMILNSNRHIDHKSNSMVFSKITSEKKSVTKSKTKSTMSGEKVASNKKSSSIDSTKRMDFDVMEMYPTGTTATATTDNEKIKESLDSSSVKRNKKESTRGKKRKSTPSMDVMEDLHTSVHDLHTSLPVDVKSDDYSDTDFYSRKLSFSTPVAKVSHDVMDSVHPLQEETITPLPNPETLLNKSVDINGLEKVSNHAEGKEKSTEKNSENTKSSEKGSVKGDETTLSEMNSSSIKPDVVEVAERKTSRKTKKAGDETPRFISPMRTRRGPVGSSYTASSIKSGKRVTREIIVTRQDTEIGTEKKSDSVWEEEKTENLKSTRKIKSTKRKEVSQDVEASGLDKKGLDDVKGKIDFFDVAPEAKTTSKKSKSSKGLDSGIKVIENDPKKTTAIYDVENIVSAKKGYRKRNKFTDDDDNDDITYMVDSKQNSKHQSVLGGKNDPVSGVLPPSGKVTSVVKNMISRFEDNISPLRTRSGRVVSAAVPASNSKRKKT